MTSFGLNETCTGVDFAFRTDQQALIDWIFASVYEAGHDPSGIQIYSL